jgi:hypothetical protein
VGIVHDQDGIFAIRQVRRGREIGHVRVHAEVAFRHEECALSCGALAQRPRRGVEVAVRIDALRAAGQPKAVDDAGMVLLVRDDEVAGLDESREDGEVRLVAAGKKQRGLRAFERGQPGLERLVLGEVSTQEPRCGRSHRAVSAGSEQALAD